MPMIPPQVFHVLFGIVAASALTTTVAVRYVFSLSAFPSSVLFLSSLAVVAKCLGHVFANLTIFAGHGMTLFGVVLETPSCPRIAKGGGPCEHELEFDTKDVKFEYVASHHYYLYKSTSANPAHAPTIFFLHGNGVPACCFSAYPEYMHVLHPHANLVCVEYPGYGKRHKSSACYSSLDAVRNDIAGAWRHVFESQGLVGPQVLVGLSLGGGFVFSSVDRLVPPPRQIVLINTFADLGVFVKGETHVYFEAVRRILPPAIMDYRVEHMHKNWTGEVLCVFTKDDEMFNPSHAARFRSHFKKHGCTWQEFMVPSGGHNQGPLSRDGVHWLKMINTKM